MRKIINEWGFENSIRKHNGEPTMSLIEFIWIDIKLYIICKRKGHHIVNDDPGDPEVGPMPNVYCIRCGKQF